MLAVVGGKGGVGKTTTALGLAAALARRGHRTTLVDCDEDMPDCARMVDITDHHGLGAIAGGASVEIVGDRPPQLDGALVLPAHPGDPVDAALRELDTAGPTILDCPGGAGPPTAVPLRHADRSLIVTTPSGEAIEDAVKSVAIARTLSAPPIGVLVTMGAAAPRGLADALETPLVGVLEGVARPLESAAGHRAYDRLCGRIQGNL